MNRKLIVAHKARTITGKVLPWGKPGATTAGSVTFTRGALALPDDLSRVKLLAGHSPSGKPVGYATHAEDTEDGLLMTFALGSGDDADRALTAATEKLIDGFSIEAAPRKRAGNTIHAADLRAVALVPVPAYADAWTDTIAASFTADDDPAEDPDPDEDPDDDGKTSTTDTPPADTGGDDHDKDNEMGKNTLTPGIIPGSGSTPPSEVHASFTDVVDHLGAVVRGEASLDDIKAELTDITDAGMIDRVAPQWLGELWNGVTYTREVIPQFSSAPLTSRTAVGYKWATKPGVDKYAGNKTEIPSKGASLEKVERESERWAGGNDLDRAFWDFGETEFLAAYWRAMNESYAFETDQNFAEFIVDNAIPIDGGADNLIHAVARASIKIKQDLRTPASSVLIAPDDYETILQMTNLEIPAYLSLIPAMDPSKWVATDFVTPGTVVVGTRNAATFYELSGSPLRVEAEHIARGGRDAALFGYTAEMINRPEGLRSVQFADAPTTPPAGE